MCTQTLSWSEKKAAHRELSLQPRLWSIASEDLDAQFSSRDLRMSNPICIVPPSHSSEVTFH